MPGRFSRDRQAQFTRVIPGDVLRCGTPSRPNTPAGLRLRPTKEGSNSADADTWIRRARSRSGLTGYTPGVGYLEC